MTLRDELTVLADGARFYGDPEAAIRTARRRRITGLVAAPALAFLAIAALLAGPYWRLITARAPGERSAGTDLTAAGPADALPQDRPVGRASFVYAVHDGAWLVTRDGHRYELRSAAGPALSPDGRWLVMDGQLRELTGDLRRKLPGRRVVAWSPNSAWLLVEDTRQQYLVQPASGKITAVASATALAVLDDGTVASQDASGSPKVAALGVLDPQRGDELRQVVVDARATLPGEEAITSVRGVGRVWFGPDDQALFAVTGGTHSALLVSLRAPQRLTAIPGAGQPLGFQDGAVLVKSAAAGSPVELRAWRDGHSTRLFRLPPGSKVLASGGAQLF